MWTQATSSTWHLPAQALRQLSWPQAPSSPMITGTQIILGPASSTGLKQILWHQGPSGLPQNLAPSLPQCLPAPGALGSICGARQLPQHQAPSGLLWVQVPAHPGFHWLQWPQEVLMAPDSWGAPTTQYLNSSLCLPAPVALGSSCCSNWLP